VRYVYTILHEVFAYYYCRSILEFIIAIFIIAVIIIVSFTVSAAVAATDTITITESQIWQSYASHRKIRDKVTKAT
jgi:hypothetical protein